MTAAWPGTINQNVNVQNFNEVPDTNNAVFQPDVGPPKMRRRSSLSTSVFTFEGWFTSTEVDNINTFYKTTLLDGTLPFTRLHPRTQANDGSTYVFLNAPDVKTFSPVLFVVTFNLRKLP